MDYRVRLGILAGLAAGAVMLVLDLTAKALGLIVFSHIALAVILPRGVIGLGRLGGFLSHFALAVLFGIIFAFVVRPLPRHYYFLLGVVYGIGLYFVNMGLIGPALGMIRPIWTYNYLTMATDLVLHLVYGGTLGALVGANAPAAEQA